MSTKVSTPAPQRYLRLGNKTLIASAGALIASALVAYPYAQRFGLGTQIAAHLAIPVSAGLFKLGYVMRLAASEAIDRVTPGKAGSTPTHRPGHPPQECD